jgi:hypothetical protein
MAGSSANGFAIWRDRHSKRERELAIAPQYRGQVAVYILRSTRAARELVDRGTPNGALNTSEG